MWASLFTQSPLFRGHASTIVEDDQRICLTSLEVILVLKYSMDGFGCAHIDIMAPKPKPISSLVHQWANNGLKEKCTTSVCQFLVQNLPKQYSKVLLQSNSILPPGHKFKDYKEVQGDGRLGGTGGHLWLRKDGQKEVICGITNITPVC